MIIKSILKYQKRPTYLNCHVQNFQHNSHIFRDDTDRFSLRKFLKPKLKSIRAQSAGYRNSERDVSVTFRFNLHKFK